MLYEKNLNKGQNYERKIQGIVSQNLIPEGVITSEQDKQLIINTCKEERWEVRGDGESATVPTEFLEIDVTTTAKSQKKIDKLTGLLSSHLDFECGWSSLVTYIDLVKQVGGGKEVRLRYEIANRKMTVKWFVVEKGVGPEEIVYVIIAEDDDIDMWEDAFMNIESTNRQVFIRHQKYFLLDEDGEQMVDYRVNDTDDDRIEVSIEDSDGNINVRRPESFIGLFVQDRYRLPLRNFDVDGLLGLREVIRIVHDELIHADDVIKVLKKYSLVGEGLRLELESYDSNTSERAKDAMRLTNKKKQILHVIENNGLSAILSKK